MEFLLFFAVHFSGILKKNTTMARICEITGKRMMTGNNVSHSHSKTRRRFYPNVHKKKFYLKEENKQLVQKISTEGMRLIDKHGLYKCVQDARQKGYLKK